MSSTTVQNFPDWAVPYAQDFLGRAGQVADLPYQPYGGATVAGFNPYQTGAYNAIAQRAAGGSPVINAASGEVQRSLSGGYLNSNPYLDAMVDRSAADIRRNMQAIEGQTAGYGNTGLAEVTARAIGDASSRIRGEDYARERGFMQNALGMALPLGNQDYTDAQQLITAGNAFQGQEQRGLDDAYTRFQEARDYPRQQLGVLGGALGLPMGRTVTETETGGNRFGRALGSLLAAYGAYNSSQGFGKSSQGGGKG